MLQAEYKGVLSKGVTTTPKTLFEKIHHFINLFADNVHSRSCWVKTFAVNLVKIVALCFEAANRTTIINSISAWSSFSHVMVSFCTLMFLLSTRLLMKKTTVKVLLSFYLAFSFLLKKKSAFETNSLIFWNNHNRCKNGVPNQTWGWHLKI